MVIYTIISKNKPEGQKQYNAYLYISNKTRTSKRYSKGERGSIKVRLFQSIIGGLRLC